MSCSASASACFNSARLLPPSRLTNNNPSGFSKRRACIISPGKSSTQCNDKQENTASKLSGLKGNSQSECTTLGPCSFVPMANFSAGSVWIMWPTLPSLAKCCAKRLSCAPTSRHRSKSRLINSSRSAKRAAAASFKKEKSA